MAKKEKKTTDLPKPKITKSKKVLQRKSTTRAMEQQPNFEETLATNLSFEELIKLSGSDRESTSDTQKAEKTLRDKKNK